MTGPFEFRSSWRHHWLRWCRAAREIERLMAIGSEPPKFLRSTKRRPLKATGDEPFDVVNSGAEEWVDAPALEVEHRAGR